MHRRSFLTLLGTAAAAWPLGAGAQQRGKPTIGILNTLRRDLNSSGMIALRKGLAETGYREGDNVTIEYRFAESDLDRLPALATDLIRREVAVIVAIGGQRSGMAAQAATKTIPIVFVTGDDPVRLGLAASYNRPGGNATGVAVLTVELGPKRLELLRELAPGSKLLAAVMNPNNPSAGFDLGQLQSAAKTLGWRLLTLRAGTAAEVDAAFATLANEQADAFMTSTDAIFNSFARQIVDLVARHRIPAMYFRREFVEAGGLASYGPDINDLYRQMGVYAGRILKGEKPADLPIVQPTRFEFGLNLKTAKALNLNIPLKLHAFADEVIE